MRPLVKVAAGISSLRSWQREWGSRAVALLGKATPPSQLAVLMGEGRCPRRRRQARFMAGGYLSVRSEVSGLVHFPPDLASVILSHRTNGGWAGGVSWVREKSFGGLAIHVSDTACRRYSPPWRHRRDPFFTPLFSNPRLIPVILCGCGDGSARCRYLHGGAVWLGEAGVWCHVMTPPPPGQKSKIRVIGRRR